MKLLPTKIMFLLFLVNLCFMDVHAQDKITMLNGEKREGKVIAVRDDAVKFIYKGESLEYEFKKAEINEIVFESGRKEIFNQSASAEKLPTVSPAERKGKIAVLPFNYITNEAALDPVAMGQQLQSDTYNALKTNTTQLQLQDLMTTNSLLAKAGLHHTTRDSKTPTEMAELLGVEYVVYGTATVTTKGSSTYQSGVTTYNGKATETKDKNKDSAKASGSTYTSNTATVKTDYDTKIDLSFYSDTGATIYSQSRQAFGSEADSYHNTISYLVKRCPFGTKAKK